MFYQNLSEGLAELKGKTDKVVAELRQDIREEGLEPTPELVEQRRQYAIAVFTEWLKMKQEGTGIYAK
jgi:hypothetical protein